MFLFSGGPGLRFSLWPPQTALSRREAMTLLKWVAWVPPDCSLLVPPPAAEWGVASSLLGGGGSCSPLGLLTPLQQGGRRVSDHTKSGKKSGIPPGSRDTVSKGGQ
ncbi:hypothetical protein H1C71_019943 [Ictidomys tridecemlineatus]|nr:hypothetical protein H1C71_019943 [Ictidomys tridecemlineatus]